MGKQKGEAARSKARPSSSSFAASLLPSGFCPVLLSVGFGGYVGKSRLDSGEDAIANTDIDSEVTQHLKRLARKDPTTKAINRKDVISNAYHARVIGGIGRRTVSIWKELSLWLYVKLKALTSLSSLVSQKAGKDIISMIPQWVHFSRKRNGIPSCSATRICSRPVI